MLHLTKIRRAEVVVWFSPERYIHAKITTSASNLSSLGLHRSLLSATQNRPKWASQYAVIEHFNVLRVKSKCGRRSGYARESRYLPNRQSRRFCSQALAVASSSQPTRNLAEAKVALFEYLYCTRMFNFTDAEHISKKSPIFVRDLLKKARNNEEAGGSVVRFLRYHPINEFEPFFESLGLSPPEFAELLPKNSIYLGDNALLLQNYYVLCNYGIARERIGRIFKEASEIFCYIPGVLPSKLEAYEGVGLSKTSIIGFASACPSILVGDVSKALLKFLAELKVMGISHEWLGNHLSPNESYNWDHIVILLKFFSDAGFGKAEMTILTKNANLLLEDSGNATFTLVGLLLKLGSNKRALMEMFARFPGVRVHTFLKNLARGLQFLVEIEMQNEDICKIVQSYAAEIGSCSLKTASSVLSQLHATKSTLCRMIIDDPTQLLNWTLGQRTTPLPRDYDWLMHKTAFLLGLGFGKDPEEMEKVLPVFRGRGQKLQERYDFFIKRGLSRSDVEAMVKGAPHILTQKVEVIERKINFLVDVLGYPLESLLSYPSYLGHSIETVKLRHLMYDWLRDKGVRKTMALSTILACSEKRFVNRHVRSHPNGLEVWENLKRTQCST